MAGMESLWKFLRRIVSDRIEVPTWLFLGLSLVCAWDGMYGLLR